MIPIIVEIVDYNKGSNTCTARLQHNGSFINFDPFVGCVIRLTAEDYEAGRGKDLIGKRYLLTAYSVYPDVVVPHEREMKEI